MRTRAVAMGILFCVLGLLPSSEAWAQQMRLWGSQEAGDMFSGPRFTGNSVNLTAPAQIASLQRNADGFTIFRNGAQYITVQKGHDLTGILPPGTYTLRPDIGSVSVYLDTQLTPQNITLWGEQTAIVNPRYRGNFVALATPATIVEAHYTGTDGMGIFRNDFTRAYLQYISPHNISNPGPKVIDASRTVVAKNLVGLTLPAGVYSLTPGRGTADGIVQGSIVMAPGAGGAMPGPAPGFGWHPVSSEGNRVEIGTDQICIDSMANGHGYAAQPLFYDIHQDYRVEFDFQLREKNNHWFILYSDTSIHLHIDWGTDLFFMGPGNSKITSLDVGRWYHFRIDAHPTRKAVEIFIDGQRAASGTDLVPGNVGVGAGNSGPAGSTGRWIYIGDDEDTGYDRGSACWKNIVIDGKPAQPKGAPVVHQVFANVPNQPSTAFKGNTFPALRMDTRSWDSVPYHMTQPFSATVTIGANQTVMLAGDAAGTQPWRVDNFVLLELTSASGTKRFVAGNMETVRYNGTPVERLGRSSFVFSPGGLELTDHFPKGVPVQVKISALDYGGTGNVSDVFLIIQ